MALTGVVEPSTPERGGIRAHSRAPEPIGPPATAAESPSGPPPIKLQSPTNSRPPTAVAIEAPMTPDTTHKSRSGPQGNSLLGSPLDKVRQARANIELPATPRPSAGTGMPKPRKLFTRAPLAQTMTPGRPLNVTPGPGGSLYGLGAGISVSTPSRRPWNTVKPSAPGSVSSGGRVNLDISANAIPPMPLRTFFMSREQCEDSAVIPDEAVRENLVKAVESSELFERAATQFRSLANHYFLQTKLLSIESHESAQRHEVETSINKREIDRLAVDVMGYSDASVSIDQIRRRLKRTKQRLKDMEELNSVKDREIVELQAQLRQLQLPQMSPHHHTELSPLRTANLGQDSEPSSEPMSALELLASQVLSDQMRRGGPNGPGSFGSPEKRRRPSSSSTISAHSEEDTLEEIPQDM